MPRGIILFLFLRSLAYSQYVTYSVFPPEFLNSSGSKTLNAYSNGTIVGSLTVSANSPAFGQLPVDTTSISQGPAFRLVITSSGSPNLGSPTTLLEATTMDCRISIAQGHDTLYPAIYKLSGTLVFKGDKKTINGYTVSLPSFELIDGNTPLPVTIDIPILVTLGFLNVSPTPINMSVPEGGTSTMEIAIDSTVPNPVLVTQNSAWFTTGPGSGPNKASITVDAFNLLPGTYDSYALFNANSMPQLFVPVHLTVTKLPYQFTASPPSLTFFYTRGQPEPAPQTVTLQAAVPTNAQVTGYDSGWISAGSSPLFVQAQTPITVTPKMSSKPSGSHTTVLHIYDAHGEIYIPISLYVLDTPGTLNYSTQPAGVGSVEGPTSATNGSTVSLTARAAPGYVFSRWSGAISSIDNPVSVLVLGTMNIVAEFTSVTGNCTFTTSPARIAAPAAGDIGRIDIKTASGCGWSFTPPANWISFVGPSQGSGSGSVSYSIAANGTSAARQTTLLGASSAIAIEQAGSACANVFAAPPPAFAAAGGTASLTATGTAGCAITPSSADSWLAIAQSGSGPDSVNFNTTATAYTGTTARTTSVSLAGIRVPILQKGTRLDTVFADIGNSAFADYINVLERAGIADLCPTGFCPDARTTRAQMAEFLVHALLRTTTFLYPTTPVFTDVPATHPRFQWIQKLYELGITTGCGANKFCPDDSVSRGQMAVFLIRTRARITAANTFPYRPAGYFTDVPAQHSFFAYIQKLRDWGITAGCDANRFCPDDIVSRGQMSVFLVRGFLTP